MRRYKGYDYSRGASLFITFGVSPRRAVFGRVAGDAVALSLAGEALAAVIAKECAKTDDILLKTSVIMPDHVHMRVHLRPGVAEPLKRLGRFIYNIKAWSRREAARNAGVGFEWERNYHDWICSYREAIDAVDAYIRNNPLKWTLMHKGNPPPLAVAEPLACAALPADEWWTGAGETALLSRKIAAVRLSRTLKEEDFPAVLRRLESAAAKGYVLAGTWISPAERMAFAALARSGAPLVRASPDPLAMVYRPKRDEPRLFAARRYLVLSRVAAPGVSRYDCWHGINAALARIAAVTGGAAVYARREAGRIVWRREDPPELRGLSPRIKTPGPGRGAGGGGAIKNFNFPLAGEDGMW